ncbi:hypothetical protein [Desulfomarina sp.]
MKGISAVLLLFCCFTAGCTRLPDFATPYISTGADELSSGPFILYRKLTRADFRAKKLPARLVHEKGRINAHATLSIRSSVNSQFRIYPAENSSGRQYCGEILFLRFDAVMFPEDSWWNPQLERKHFAYVLQHEQIHFALMARGAARLAGRAEREMKKMEYCGITEEEARKKMLSRLRSFIHGEKKVLLREHTAFDEDTSGRFNRRLQNWWYKKVTGAL